MKTYTQGLLVEQEAVDGLGNRHQGVERTQSHFSASEPVSSLQTATVRLVGRLEELSQPVERFLVAKTTGNRAHEHLNGANVGAVRRGAISVVQSEGFAELLL